MDISALRDEAHRRHPGCHHDGVTMHHGLVYWWFTDAVTHSSSFIAGRTGSDGKTRPVDSIRSSGSVLADARGTAAGVAVRFVKGKKIVDRSKAL